jgi:hypothetical protein
MQYYILNKYGEKIEDEETVIAVGSGIKFFYKEFNLKDAQDSDNQQIFMKLMKKIKSISDKKAEANKKDKVSNEKEHYNYNIFCRILRQTLENSYKKYGSVSESAMIDVGRFFLNEFYKTDEDKKNHMPALTFSINFISPAKQILPSKLGIREVNIINDIKSPKNMATLNGKNAKKNINEEVKATDLIKKVGSNGGSKAFGLNKVEKNEADIKTEKARIFFKQVCEGLETYDIKWREKHGKNPSPISAKIVKIIIDGTGLGNKILKEKIWDTITTDSDHTDANLELHAYIGKITSIIINKKYVSDDECEEMKQAYNEWSSDWKKEEKEKKEKDNLKNNETLTDALVEKIGKIAKRYERIEGCRMKLIEFIKNYDGDSEVHPDYKICPALWATMKSDKNAKIVFIDIFNKCIDESSILDNIDSVISIIFDKIPRGMMDNSVDGLNDIIEKDNNHGSETKDEIMKILKGIIDEILKTK